MNDRLIDALIAARGSLLACQATFEDYAAMHQKKLNSLILMEERIAIHQKIKRNWIMANTAESAISQIDKELKVYLPNQM